MAKEVKARFKISEGIITIQGKKLWEKEMLERFGKDCDIVATFRMPRRNRSNKQNNFYWGLTILEIIDALVDAGYERYLLTPENVHDMLKNKFLTVTIPSTEFAGEFITLVRDSKTLTTTEWMQYTNDVSKWCQEFLNFVPSVPDEQKELDLE